MLVYPQILSVHSQSWRICLNTHYFVVSWLNSCDLVWWPYACILYFFQSEALLEGLLQNGRLTFGQLVERTISKVPEGESHYSCCYSFALGSFFISVLFHFLLLNFSFSVATTDHYSFFFSFSTMGHYMFQAVSHQQGRKYEWTSTNLYLHIMWSVARNLNLSLIHL